MAKIISTNDEQARKRLRQLADAASSGQAKLTGGRAAETASKLSGNPAIADAESNFSAGMKLRQLANAAVIDQNSNIYRAAVAAQREQQERTRELAEMPSMRAPTTSTAEQRLALSRLGMQADALNDPMAAAQKTRDEANEYLRTASEMISRETTDANGNFLVETVENPDYYPTMQKRDDANDILERLAAEQSRYQSVASGMQGYAETVEPILQKTGVNASELFVLLDNYYDAGITSQNAGAQSNAALNANALQNLSEAESALRGIGLSDEDFAKITDYWSGIRNANQSAMVSQMLSQTSKEHPIAGSLLSVPLNLASGVGYVDALAQKAAGKQVDYNSMYQNIGKAGQTIRGAISEDMTSGGQFLYNTAMSMADSATVGLLSAIGVPAASVLLGGSAATSAMHDAYQRGGSDEQALGVGLLAGAAETLFERVSIGNLVEMASSGVPPKTIADFIANALVQGGVEASEEVLTSIANTITDQLVMKDLGTFSQNAEKLGINGALDEWATGLTLDALGGFLSGGIMGGGVTALSSVAGSDAKVAPEVVAELVEKIQNMQMPHEMQAAPTAQVAQATPTNLEAAAIQAVREDAAEREAEAKRAEQLGATLGEAGSRAFAKTFDGSMPAQEAFDGFRALYNTSLTGAEMTEAQKRAAARLPETMVHEALVSAKLDTIRARDAKFFGLESDAIVRDEAFKKAHLSSKNIRTLEGLARVTKTQIRFAENLKDADGNEINASYQNGVITVSLKSENPVMTAVAHEVVHRIREISPDTYETLSTFVSKNVDAFMTTRKLTQLARDYDTGDIDALSEEFIADAFGALASNSDVLQRFAIENRSAAQKIADVFRDLANAVNRILNNQNIKLSKEERAVFKDLLANYEKSASVFEAAIQRAGDSANESVTGDLSAEAESRIAANKPVNAVDEVKNSRKHDTKYMDAAEKKNNGRISLAVMRQAREARQAIADIFNDPDLADALGLPPDIIGNTYIPNSSYSGTEENTTVCIRSIAADALMDAVSEYLGRPLTVEDTVTISQELFRFTDKPECLYCYVAMDRKAYREFLGSYLKQRDAALENIRNGMSKEEAYEKFRDGRKDTGPMRDRFNMWVANQGKPMITANDLASYANMEKAMERDKSLTPQINDALKYAQSASWAKKRMSYAAYNNHILKWPQTRIDNLNSNFGLRMYSFSDFSPAFILENMQMITDAAVRGLKVLAYTKELDFVRIFAKTGMNINISVFGYNDGNGGVAQDGMQGADWAPAQELRNQYGNVGITFVATNDKQVEWALDQGWIDVVIPFHLVRTGKKVASYFGWTDYTSMSSDLKTKQFNKETDKAHILPPDHQNDKQMYLDACEQNHLKPRFEKWVDHPNYMKLVNETRRSEGATPTVQPIFDVDAAKQSIDDMIAKGGYYKPIGGDEENMRDIAEEIGEGIKKTAPEGGVKYSRTKALYAGKNLSSDGEIYTYDFLTALPDMSVTTLPEVDDVRGEDGKVDTGSVVSLGIKNARTVGTERGGKLFVQNVYTGRDLRIDVAAIRHGLNGGIKRLLTNARIGAVVGEVVKNAVPINALHNKAAGVTGTYAMAAYTVDSRGREFVAIVTIEQRTGNVSSVEAYDVTHAVSGRQKNSNRADTESQGVYPSTVAKVTISDFLDIVNTTHQSVLSNDVLLHLGEEKPENGFYTKQTKFSRKSSPRDEDYLSAVNRGDMETAQKMVDEAAIAAGYNIKLYHGTSGDPFYVFRQGTEGIHFGTLAQATQRAKISEDRYGYRSSKYTSEDIRKKPTKYPDSARREILEQIAWTSPLELSSNEQDMVSGAIYGDGPVSDEMLLRFVDRAEREANVTAYTLTNRNMGNTTGSRIISAYVRAQHPIVFDVDIGEWIPLKLAGILMDKIEGNMTSIYDRATGSWVKYNPQDIQGIDLTEDDLPTLRRLQDTMYFDGLARFLIEKGVDSIRYLNTYEGTLDEESYILLSPEQVKSADPVTYDDNGEIIPLSERFNPENNDIRYSRKSDYETELEALREKYGIIEPGEKATREANVPRQTSADDYVSQTIRTVIEAGVTPDEILPEIDELIAKGQFSYEVYTDEDAIAGARATIEKEGWTRTYKEWGSRAKTGIVSKADTALGWELYNNAVSEGDTKAALDILDTIIGRQRNAAQALQATRILKTLSPEAQLYGAQRSVVSLQEELTKKYGKKAPSLKIDEDLARAFLEAKTDEARATAMRRLYQDIGRQMPSNFMDKWNAWRYLAMLGNPRTHVRNVLGNALFAPVVATKNLTATAIEKVVYGISKGQMERSKALIGTGKVRKELLKAAYDDYAACQELIMGGGKYSDAALKNQYIQDGRQIFKFKPLEKARKGNSNLMELEDSWFSKPHYAYALASYCKASGISSQTLATDRSKLTKAQRDKIDKARAYAIREAQKATYRDSNALSEFFSKAGKVSGNTEESQKVAKIWNALVEGVLPFRKTPANILARGIEYSPLGFMNGLYKAIFEVHKGKATAAEAIDSISAGFTGTMLMVLGGFLAAQGVVRGLGSGDEDEREFDELQGHQTYALEIGDKSFTLDWMAPEALPFFVGVNLYEQTLKENESVTMAAILEAMGTVSDPMLSMSCLQSLNDLIDTVGSYSSDETSGLVSIAASAATSYVTQAIPTLLGQIERTSQADRMTTYTEKNSFLTGDMQYTLGRASSRIPIWEHNQIPYIDAWGRAETTDSALVRGLNNMINPAYSSVIVESEMEAELERLYDVTSDSAVFPSRAEKSFNVDKKPVYLTAEQYVKYATVKGQNSYNFINEVVASAFYKSADDVVKTSLIKNAYEYANALAKTTVSDYKLSSWYKKAYEATSYGVSLPTFLQFRAIADADGNDSVSQEEAAQAIEKLGISNRLTKAKLWQSCNSQWNEKNNPFR